MKIFQIVNDICHWDATIVHPTLHSTLGKYPPEVLFVEAPDNVYEGWGYDDTEQGSARFVQPLAPPGWTYDENTGTFYSFDMVKGRKLEEISGACQATIIKGCDVELSDGVSGHISLTNEDQINLISANEAVRDGATGYPYHLDGELCRVFSAQDIVTMAETSGKHKIYHTTYCNHM